MGISPLQGGSGVLHLVIQSEGAAIASSIEVQSVDVVMGFNRIPRATIALVDGDMPNACFPNSDSEDFAPGKAITVQAGYGSEAATIFQGIVVRHGVTIGESGDARLELDCRSKALGMTVGRNCANNQKSTDSAAMTALLGKHGLEAEVTATTFVHEELVQYECTDWDFLVARAEVNGLLVLVDGSKVSVGPPETAGEPDLTVTYGRDVMEFQADLDSGFQLQSVVATSWDPAAQAVVEKNAPPAALTGNGNIAGAALAKALAVDPIHLRSGASLDASLLETWTKAEQLKAELSRVRGRVKFQGSALAKVGKLLELAGVGDRFNGKVLVTGIRHEIRDGNWTTEASFGMDPGWFAERHQVTAPAASGTTAGAVGLQIGVVKKLDGDPSSHYRIQVSVPVMQFEKDGIWARLAGDYATSGAGTFFVPEVGDEVVLGFLNDDPGHPVVLGSLHSSKTKAPFEIAAENFTKAIVSKSKVTIKFDDEKKILTLSTPGKNSITVSDEGKSILLEDQNGNKVRLDSAGIALESAKDIVLNSKGNITLDAVGKIAISAKQDLAAEGLNIKLDAKVGMTAKGAATAEFSASGQTTVKGAMVMIN